MVNTATLKAVSFEDGVLNFAELEGTYKKGDTMQNITYAPSCEVDNCIIRNTRARGFVIQTSNVEIKNCTFFGMSMNAIKVAPDFNYWYEVGPTYNFYMHDNIIEKCAFRTPGEPSIGIFTSHRANDETVTHLHKNIRLENNVIKRSHSNCITVTAADTVNISGNRFEDREVKDVDPIKLINCTDVKIENNTEA
jgi:hypothetical protein